jgi:hypothetical protein
MVLAFSGMSFAEFGALVEEKGRYLSRSKP